MHLLYSLVSGPLAWFAFAVFIGGSIWKIATLANLAKKKDNAVYEYWSLDHAMASIFHWLAPFGSRNWRLNPVMTVVTFTFHFCLLLVPLCLAAHVILWKESFDIAWMTIPDGLADYMTMAVIAGAGFFIYRRRTRPDVAFLTSRSDYILLAITVAPFITGFWAAHQWFGYRLMYILHVFSGEVWLVAIPFTRLSHAILFVFTRGYMGSEFGAVRHARDY
ncbi:MAG: nitrate reductase [Desulfobacterales bacterium]|nr:MAG: nitrate reductase [Desulfobacterales bacterium]